MEIVPQKIEIGLIQKRVHHARYMRNYRQKKPAYREKQKLNFQKFYEKNPTYFHDYNRKWKERNPQKAYEYTKKYRQNHPEKRKEERAKYALRHPDKKSARRKSLNLKAVRCQVCGSYKKLERHHPDYSQPLSFVPLCHNCHVLHHRLLKVKEAQ